MPEVGKRIRLLCEDRRTERFGTALCKRYDVHVLEVISAPKAGGDASVWVTKKYADEVRRRRSKNFQANLGLLVVIDGDKHGVSGRKDQLAKALQTSSVEARVEKDSIAILVPTWSIETWLALLNGRHEVSESQSVKADSVYRDMWRDEGAAERATIQMAVQSWKKVEKPLPSLSDAYGEAPRVWVG